MKYEQMNILTIFPAPFFSSPDTTLLHHLESIQPGIRARDVSDLFSPNRREDASVRKTLDKYLADADIIFGLALPRNIILRAPRLKWIQIAAAGSKLWDLPNTLLSPHIGGARADYLDLATEIFYTNLKLFMNGKRLKNIVDKRSGY